MHKLALARAYHKWAAEEAVQGTAPAKQCSAERGVLPRFLRENSAITLCKALLQQETMLLRRSLALHRGRQWLPPAPEASAQRVRRFRERFRVPSKAGRPVKAGVVREELYDWFCLLKRSVQGRIPAAFVLQKACTLVEDYVLECARREVQAHAPVV